MTTQTTGSAIADRVFLLALIGKGIDGVLELVGGLLLWLVPATALTGLVGVLTQHELSEDPNDLVATSLRALAQHLGSSSLHGFAVIYLIGHGIIKLLLVIALLRRMVRAYPFAIALLLAFIGYQLYRYAHAHSAALLAFAGLDLLITVLVVREYRHLRRGRRPAAT